MAITETKTDIIPVGEGTKSKLTIRHPHEGFEQIEITLPSGKSFMIGIMDHEEFIEITEGESKWESENSIFASPKTVSQLRIGLMEIKTFSDRQNKS